MSNTFWKEQSEKFDEAARYYDQYRPSYPKALINAIIDKSDLSAGANILEIGAGSGKATELFVPHGFNMTCIEPGENLVKEGHRKFKESGNVEFCNTRFEEWKDRPDYFDLAISAQAFHWVQKPLAYEKCSMNLKKGKNIALFWNYYLSNEEPIDQELCELIAEYPIMYIASEDSIIERIEGMIEEIQNSGFFHEPTVLKYPWIQRYTEEEYIGFIKTSNGYLSLNEEDREIVKNRVRELIKKNGGYIDRPYLSVGYLAERKRYNDS